MRLLGDTRWWAPEVAYAALWGCRLTNARLRKSVRSFQQPSKTSSATGADLRRAMCARLKADAARKDSRLDHSSAKNTVRWSWTSSPTSACAPRCQRHGMMSQVTNASQEIDSIIKGLGDWRGEALARLRVSIRKASPGVVEEVKWKKPSNPAGVPVWSHDGIVCIGDALKNSVRLTFPKGALIADPEKLFNARLDSKTNRAIDVREGEPVDAAAFAALIRDAVRLNLSKVRRR